MSNTASRNNRRSAALARAARDKYRPSREFTIRMLSATHAKGQKMMSSADAIQWLKDYDPYGNT